MLELDDESKIIKILVIKEICSWLPPWLDGWKVCGYYDRYTFFFKMAASAILDF